MIIDKLASLIKTEISLRKLVEEYDPGQDEFISLYISETPKEYQFLFRAIINGLTVGRTDFELQSNVSNNLTRNLTELSEYIGYEVDCGDDTLTLNKKPEVKSFDYKDSCLDSLVSIFGDEFECHDESKLRVLLKQFLEVGGCLEISQDKKTKVKNALHKAGENIAKGIAHSSKNSLEISYSSGKIGIRKKRSIIKVDLSYYRSFNITPGAFIFEQEHIDLLCNTSVSEERINKIHSEFNGVKDPNATLFSAYLGISNDFYRYVRSNITSTRCHPFHAHVKSLFDDRLLEQYEGAHYLIQTLENLEITDLESAVRSLSNTEISRINKVIPGKDYQNLKGIIGNLLGIVIMYELKKMDSEGKASISSARPGREDTLSDLNMKIIYTLSGKSLDLYLGLENICELDGLMLYGGIPIVFECKSLVRNKNKDGRLSDMKKQLSQSSRVLSKLYGVYPIAVCVLLSQMQRFIRPSKDRYYLDIPVLNQMHDYTNKLLKEKEIPLN